MASKKSDVQCVHSGYVVKLGAFKKNWKTRWLVLTTDGALEYFKKESEAAAGEEPQGRINIPKDCVGLLTWEQIDGIKWPSDAGFGCGFGIQTRKGRTYFMYCSDKVEASKWLTVLPKFAANARYEDGGEMIKKYKLADADFYVCPSPRTTESSSATIDEDEAGSGSQSTLSAVDQGSKKDGVCYVHRVIGGVVMKHEHDNI